MGWNWIFHLGSTSYFLALHELKELEGLIREPGRRHLKKKPTEKCYMVARTSRYLERMLEGRDTALGKGKNEVNGEVQP